MTVPITHPLVLSSKAIPFSYKTYNEDWTQTFCTKRKLTVPRPDTYRYVFWEKDYVCKWFVKENKAKLPDTIRTARYKAYPVGPGRIKAGKEESLTWVKTNLPYICLLHCYTDFEVTAKVYLQFKDEFAEAEDAMQRRANESDKIKSKNRSLEDEEEEAYGYYPGFNF